MKTLQLLCVVLAFGATWASSLPKSTNPRALSLYTRVFSLPNFTGTYFEFYDYVPDLFESGINDDIDSVKQTGMWIYYENSDYNADFVGRLYFVHGIDIEVNFPSDYMNMMTSLRYVGNNQFLNDDTWTLFDGEYFAGPEFYGVTDAASLDYMDLSASSLVLTGQSSWTVYSGQSWTGDALCVDPDTDHDVGPFGDVLDFGIYPSMSTLGINDNSIRSVRKGCFSEKVVRPSQIKYEGKAKNGAWGYVDL